MRIVHSDIQVKNVLLADWGHVSITDFGHSHDKMQEMDRTASLSGVKSVLNFPN